MTTSTGASHAAVVRMAHDIARQFAQRPREHAVDEISAHILKFWDPRMRAELRRCVLEGQFDLDPLVTDAVYTWPDEEDTQADRREPSGG